MGQAFTFTQNNSAPFSGLDGTVVISDGTQSTDKLKLIRASGFGMGGLQMQTQVAPFQQGASMIRTLFDTRQVVLECAISVANAATTGLAEVTTIRRSLSRRLSPAGMGFLPTSSLSNPDYATYLGQLAYAADGVTYDRFIDVVPMTVDYAGTSTQDGFQKLRIVFFCPDPFWYGAEVSYTVNGTPGGMGVTNIRGPKFIPELGCFYSLRGFQGSGGLNHFYRSIDGIRYDAVGMTTDGDYRDFAYHPTLNRFVVVGGSSAFAYSDDLGVTWTYGSNPTSGKTCLSVEYCPWIDNFIGINLTSDKVFIGNGASWTQYTHAGGSTFDWTLCVSPDRREIVAVSKDATNRTQKSSDGQTWVAYAASSAKEWVSVCWSPTLALYCSCATNSTNGIMTSPDAQTWTGRTCNSDSTSDVIWSEFTGLFIALGSDSFFGANLFTSVDGITWTDPSTGYFGVSTIGRVASGESLGVISLMTSAAGNARFSYDGVHTAGVGTSKYVAVTNDGDVPIPFQFEQHIVSVAASTYLSIGSNVSVIDETQATPNSSTYLLISKTGLNIGDVEIDTTSGIDSITMNGVSVLNNMVAGSFFKLPPGTINFYVSSTSDTPPPYGVVTIRPRYISV